MANQTLIAQAEKMYKSQADTTDYAKLLLDPAVTAMKENIASQKALLDDQMSKMPMGVEELNVPEELRETVTEFTAEWQKKYIEAAKITSSGIASTDPRYLEARKVMNNVKTAFENLDLDLKTLKLQVQTEKDEKNNLAGGFGGQWQELDSLKFANKTIYDSIKENGIGVDGKLSYTSGELDDNNQAKVKFISDYGGAPRHNSGAITAINEVINAIINDAKGCTKWDMGDPNSVYGSTITDRVDQIINDLGPEGVKDIMFKYERYIDGYIKMKHPELEKGSTEHETKKLELSKTDLTDEFRELLLGTKEKPGVFRNAHTDNYKATNPNEEPGTLAEKAQQRLALGVKRLDPRIVTKMGGAEVEWTKEMIEIDGTKVPIYYTETEDGVAFKTPYELQSYAGDYSTQKGFPADMMILSAENQETVRKYFKDKGIGVSPYSVDTIKDTIGASVKGDMVGPLNAKYNSEGFSFKVPPEDSKQGKEAKRIEVTYKGITKLLPFNAKFYDNLAKFMEGQLP